MLKSKNFINRLKQKRLTFFIKFAVFFSILFVIYQFIIAKELGNELSSTKQPEKVSPVNVRGTHEKQARFYENRNGNFSCITSMEIIEYYKVNDDYCDCLDGTDEPGTNACSNGIFYCETQAIHHPYPKVISSSKVNDGICDCCDGSDEWKGEIINKNNIKKSGILQKPCKNLCSNQKSAYKY